MSLNYEVTEEKLSEFDKEFHNLIRKMNKSGNCDQLYDLLDTILSFAINSGYNEYEILPSMNKFFMDDYFINSEQK